MLLAILTTLLCTKSSLSSLWKETTRATKVALAAQEAFAAGRLSGREEARLAPALREAKLAYKAFARRKPFRS